jgi:tetratricopeptide (TPR) repeat protein
MQNDPYSPCPCGSGKKFKWCCQPIHALLTKVFELDSEGQREAAMRAMDEIVAQHPTNPEVYGQQAMLLFRNEKPEDAEKTLEKAFELFPNYPFGYFLKARFRQYEGELRGALTLFRKAAELYDPNAVVFLAEIYVEIFQCEMSMNRPIAARAALELAARFAPASTNLREGINSVFGKDNPTLPAIAAQLHAFKKLPDSASAERRSAWEAALKTASTGKLTDAAAAFERLTQDGEVEPAAWYNYGLCAAWLGNNAAALEALDRYVASEPDEAQAAEAWAVGEVLRLGNLMEDAADVLEYSYALGVRDPQAALQVLSEYEKQGLLAGARVDEEQGIVSALILETPPPALTPELAAKQSLKPAAYFRLVGNFVRIWNSEKESLDKVLGFFKEKLGGMIAEAHAGRAPAKMLDIFSPGLRIPRQAASNEEAAARVREVFEKYFEDEWLYRPLKSLNGVKPVDAGGDPVLRKKLRGVLLFLKECAALTRTPYDFERLTSKLGMSSAAPASTSPADGASKPNIAALSAEQLAGVAPDTLSSAELDLAYQTALKLDARELAGKFASLLVGRPPYAERSDRFPLYQLLVNQATAQGNFDSALDYVNEGEADDCSNNEGKRRNEWELRRAQLHAKRGEYDQAKDVFDRLIARVPNEMSYRISATETMLSARQKEHALAYAKEGHAAAVKQKNRDLEGHFQELMSAAQK